jgi:membrane protein YdbS with pleckstrin-like domain
VADEPTPEPTRRLAPEARGMFAVEVLAGAAPFAAAAIALALMFVGGALGIAIAVVAVALAVAAAVIVPRVRLARFRYEVREDEIDLRRGVLVETRTLVPMERVQHVDMRRTVLSRLFGLAAVVFHTAAGANEIPALRDADAAQIRDRIADLAKTPEVL